MLIELRDFDVAIVPQPQALCRLCAEITPDRSTRLSVKAIIVYSQPIFQNG